MYVRHTMPSLSSLLTLCLMLAAVGSPSALGGERLPDRFTLGRYLPADAWVYVHYVHNPERAWLHEEWSSVFKALLDSGVHEELLSWLLESLSPEQHADHSEVWAKIAERFRAVRWSQLWEREAALAERVSSGPLGTDYILLFRGKPDSAKRNFSAIVALVREIAAIDQTRLSLQIKLTGDVEHCVLRLGPQSQPLFNLSLFRRGDVIGIASGAQAAESTLRRLAGHDTKTAFVDTPRFKAALAQVPAPEDLVLFFDMKRIMGSVRGMAGRAMRHRGKQDGIDSGSAAFLIKGLCDTCNVMDYLVWTIETNGRRQETHSLIRLQSGKQSCHLASAWLCRQPFKRFDEYIPQDATSFSLSGSVDLERLYTVVTGFVKKAFPNGEAWVASWNDRLTSVGFDPKRDLFDWWSGEMVTVSLPLKIVTPFTKSDTVVMIRVKDAELASRKVNALLSRVSEFAAGDVAGQSLSVTPAPVSVSGFRKISHPALMMFMTPVVGVTGDWLVLGTSPSAVNRCLDVAAGRAPSIATNARFQREGLVPGGTVRACSFKDTSKLGQELASQAAMLGMMGGLFAGSMPSADGETKAFRRAVQRLSRLAMKLGPVFQQLDFLSSQASMTVYDGALNLRTEHVVTYRSPKAAPEAKTADAKKPSS